MEGNLSSNATFFNLPNYQLCNAVFTGIFTIYIFLLPLFFSVLFLGCQQWRKQRSGASSGTMSHLDFFALNMVSMEIIGVLGSCFYCHGVYMLQTMTTAIGFIIFSIVSPGQALFHLITCFERYLAVVHPVTYMGLRQTYGVRIRNITIGCVWLICIASAPVQVPYLSILFHGIFLLLSFIVVFICNFCVLCVLHKSGPGHACRNRGRVDQMKQRAFLTTMAITCSLSLKFLTSTFFMMSYLQSGMDFKEHCVLMWCTTWFALPSSLVLPLLFLQRAGKLPACKRSSESVGG